MQLKPQHLRLGNPIQSTPFRKAVWEPNQSSETPTLVHVLWAGPRPGVGGVRVRMQLTEHVGNDLELKIVAQTSADGETWNGIGIIDNALAEPSPANGGVIRTTDSSQVLQPDANWLFDDDDTYRPHVRIGFSVKGIPSASGDGRVTIEGELLLLPEGFV